MNGPPRRGRSRAGTWPPRTIDRVVETVVVVTLLVVDVHLALVHRHWFADGSHFLLDILVHRRFVDFGWTRIAAIDVTELPIVFALRVLHVEDVATLSVLFGLGLFLHRVVALAICAVVLGRGSLLAFSFPAFSLLVTEPVASMFIISEAHFASSAFWIAWSCLVRRGPLGRGHAVVLVVALLAFAFSYPSTVVLGPVLGMLALHRLARVDRGRRLERRTLYAATALAGLGVVLGVVATIAPVTAANRAGFAAAAGLLARSPLPWLAALATLAFALQALALPRVAQATLAAVTVVLVAALGLRPWLLEHAPAYWLHYPGRLFLVVVPAVMALAGALALRRPPDRARERLAAAQVLAALIAATAWQLRAALAWQAYLDCVRVEVAAQRGVVPFESTALSGFPHRALTWSWTQPSVSILVQALDGRPVRTVIANPTDHGFQPFDPHDAAQLPDLRHLGVDMRVHD
jgi:hypothetical protein